MFVDIVDLEAGREYRLRDSLCEVEVVAIAGAVYDVIHVTDLANVTDLATTTEMHGTRRQVEPGDNSGRDAAFVDSLRTLHRDHNLACDFRDMARNIPTRCLIAYNDDGLRGVSFTSVDKA